MENIRKYVLFAVVLACVSQAAYARRGAASHDNVFIEKGRTVKEDIATDGTITVNGVLDGTAVSLGGAPVTVSGRVTGDVVSIGGRVDITGRTDGDVAGIGGSVTVSGAVAGAVTTIGGSVELAGTGEVAGDIAVVGGSVVKGKDTVHKGEVISFDVRMMRDVRPRVLRTARRAGELHERWDIWPWVTGGIIGLGVLVLFSLLATGAVLLILPAVFFPKNVENSAAAIAEDMWKACGIGALMVVGFVPVLLMMVISILGIPLVPFALMLYFAAGALGLGAFSVVLQERFFKGIKTRGPSGLPGKVGVGYALMAGLIIFGKLIPFIGGILSLIGIMLLSFGAMLGLGAVWMTRMGSRHHAGHAAAVPPLH